MPLGALSAPTLEVPFESSATDPFWLPSMGVAPRFLANFEFPIIPPFPLARRTRSVATIVKLIRHGT